MNKWHRWMDNYIKPAPAENKKDNRSPREKTLANAKLSLVYTPYIYIVIISLILISLKLSGVMGA